jgi:DNA-binding winged helix-turn-helix (wHTH) protein
VAGVTIRILADREPYASFSDAATSEGDAVAFGPPFLDAPPPDIVVMPAYDFLALPGGRPFPSDYVAYGPVALMDPAFAQGCIDYLREPWTFSELRARLKRFQSIAFAAGGKLFRLEGAILRNSTSDLALLPDEEALLRILLRNAPLPVARRAVSAALSNSLSGNEKALGRGIRLLRRRLSLLAPELGESLLSVRGFGYRFAVQVCG